MGGGGVYWVWVIIGMITYGTGLATGEATPKHKLETKPTTTSGTPIVVSSMSTKQIASSSSISIGEITVFAGRTLETSSFFKANLAALKVLNHANQYGVDVINKILSKTLSNHETLQK